MNEEQRYEAAKEAAIGYFKAAGFNYDEATGMFTDFTETYEVMIPGQGTQDHPAYGVAVAASEVLEELGIYDPMDGRFGFGRVRNGEDGKAEVFLRLLPDESLLLETFAGSYDGASFDFYQLNGGRRILAGDWTVVFTDGGPALPASRTISRLGPWTLYGRAYEVFSGTAEYRFKLAGVQDKADAWELDLGDVRESASVWLNGKCLGTLFEKPFAVRLTQEQAERGGELVVKVSNLMANRIIDMDRNGKPWKIFYNANIQPRIPISRAPDGSFSAANWDIRESGLLGPVTLAALSVQQ